MNKVTTIHLNGKAYQIEEAGFDALRAYLADAEAHLSENPDKAEIIGDLEQAIGEKCQKFLAPHKDIITEKEILQIIQEMGPVGTGEEAAGAETKSAPKPPKKLYLIREGSILAGVCTGLAAYFDIDVTIVRIIFIALTFITGGGWILAYIAMALFIPYANTTEERAAARGEAFRAQDIIDRAKATYEDFSKSEKWSRWKRDWKQRAHDHRKYWENYSYSYTYTPPQQTTHHGPANLRSVASVCAGIISVALATLWLIALLSLVFNGDLFGWSVPETIPLWAVISILFFGFHATTGPLKAVRHSANPGYPKQYSFWSAVEDMIGVAFIFIAGIFLYSYYPAVQDFVHSLPQQIQGWIEAIRQS